MEEPGKGATDLTGVGKWGDMGRVFVERIADAVGGIFRPTQIRRVAHAEADAKIMHAQADVIVRKINVVGEIEVQDMQRRAITRLVVNETRHQANIESIAGQAVPLITEQAKPEQMEDDWIDNFFDKAKSVSNEQMQQVWAHILAAEANNPGSFYKRTVNLVASLDRYEAEWFVNLCRFAWTMGANIVPAVFDFRAPIYMDNGVAFNQLTTLDSIGLIEFDTRGHYVINVSGDTITLRYFGTRVELGRRNEKENLIVGHVALTNVGEQLASICNSDPVPGFVEYSLTEWQKLGYTVRQVHGSQLSPEGPQQTPNTT